MPRMRNPRIPNEESESPEEKPDCPTGMPESPPTEKPEYNRTTAEKKVLAFSPRLCYYIRAIK